MDQPYLPVKSAVVVHDLSCVGRCALTVVIPALAAMGVQPCPLPTAALSTHTGGYQGMASQDLTGFMSACVAHWKSLGLKFDAVYSGYLADARQAKVVEGLIGWQREQGLPLVVVDPVLGDEGRLYSGMPSDMPEKMRALCRMADLITPNLTEAALLTGAIYSDAPRSPAEIAAMLASLNAARAMITSVPIGNGRFANVCAARGEPGYWQCAFEPVRAHYPGTGDLFASVITGALMRGDSAEAAMEFATRYLCRVVADSFALHTEARAGVQLERSLGLLMGPLDGPACEYVVP